MTQVQITKIYTSCNHQFYQPDLWKDIKEGATFDCPECGNLEVLEIKSKRVEYTERTSEPWEWDRVEISLLTQDFHSWMNSRNPSWPKDGNNTGYIDIAPELPKICSNPQHDHKLEDNQTPGYCNDCGEPAYFDEGSIDYYHSDNKTFCFLTSQPDPQRGWTPCSY